MATETTSSPLAVGILVGGRGLRLGGVAKGLLVCPAGVTIVEHQLTQIATAAPHAHVYLLGRHAEYAHLQLPHLTDMPQNIGPLGGLHALLNQNYREVVLIGCDMPFVTAQLLTRLLSGPCATAIAAKGSSPYFETLFSRFNVQATLPVATHLIEQGRYSLQGVLTMVGAHALELSPDEANQLRDWDTPSDIPPA